MPSELIICDDIWVDCNKQADGSAGSAVSRHCYRKSCLRRRCKKAVTSVHFGYELEQIVRVTIVVVNKQRFERHADQGCSRSPRSSGGGGGLSSVQQKMTTLSVQKQRSTLLLSVVFWLSSLGPGR